ncbi:hypothetical protein EZ313_07825 [Ramlibacter henchirensis]|uniref:Spore coat protein U/FanG domain-containing protein n=1 Tax=Ramlibacter henchirensis TaxID=204072 RepID=A0A4Z0C6M7_9BURK|nr:spore coat protein U domain-containing protein [Ramlibacter henchirensis]TFZ06532.1 hypothetical protein EZ313_07825 [Ramlibacter henchirensis]
MKKLLLPLLMALASLAQAQTATGNFNVAITLTTACTLNTPANGALAYTSFAASESSATPASINVRCTNTLPYTATLDGGATTTSNVYTFTDGTLNLTYRLTLAAAGLTGTGTNVGNGGDQAYTITPSVNTAQSGTCATDTCSSTAAHTLTITY